MNKRTIPLIAAAASLALLAGCAGGDPSDTGTDAGATPAGDPTDIRYLTSFNTFGRDAYVYVAEEEGYFAEANLNVEVTPGTGSGDVIKLIASGQADFGIADINALAVSLASEELDVVAVAAIHQSSLAGQMTTASSGITDAADLVGRSFADQPGSVNETLFRAWATASGIDPTEVQFVSSTPPALPQLLASGQVDTIGQLAVGQPLIQAALPDDEAVFIPYAAELPDLYGNALIVNKDFLAENPDASAAFVDALLAGLETSVADPALTGEVLVTFQPTQNADVAAQEVEIMSEYVGTSGDIGRLDADRLEATLATLVDVGAIPEGSVGVDDLVTFDLQE
ncbi:ABC transporter substrate-binding protein [Microbacterium sp. 18062]|uniref:ABC transporter substrate-binding protein n=1 Tax=Microbacterium sp. 18062 TaxID=2681410 RepID=UPI00135877EE|nr:ABC transporter substrate-binding protein [Microbacterium sp. 18062]